MEHRPLRVALVGALEPLSIILSDLRIRKKYQLDIEYFAHGVELVEMLRAGRFGYEPELLVLSLGPAAMALNSALPYRPFFVLPRSSHVLAVSRKLSASRRLLEGTFAVGYDGGGASTTVRALMSRGAISKKKSSLSSGVNSDDAFRALLGGDTALRYPFPLTSASCLAPVFPDLAFREPEVDWAGAELVVLAHRSLWDNPALPEILQSELRDSWFVLAEGRRELRDSVRSVLRDRSVLTFLKRMMGSVLLTAAQPTKA